MAFGNGVEVFTYTQYGVQHMQADAMYDDSIIFADGSGLRTTTGQVTSEIAGFPSESGYMNGDKDYARFFYISGFHQIAPDCIVVADGGNHCLRLVTRNNMSGSNTTDYIGSCENPGYRNELGYVQFNDPSGVYSNLENADSLFITDYGNNALRLVNTTSGNITCSTLIKSDDKLVRPKNLIQDRYGNIYITTHHAVMQFVLETKALTTLSGSFRAGRSDGTLLTARFDDPSGIAWLNNVTIILTDRKNRRIRVLDLERNLTSTVCDASMPSRLSNCMLVSPSSLMVRGAEILVGNRAKIISISGM